MPYAACPACRTAWKYPRDATPGTQVTCPDCEEVLVPPQLRENTAKPGRKAYDPNEEEAYEAERPIADPDAEQKTRHAVAAVRRAAAEARSRPQTGPKLPWWFNGPEVWLLIFAIGAGGGVPFGFWLARNWEKLTGAKFFWLMLVLVAVMLAAVSLGMSSWAWLRKKR